MARVQRDSLSLCSNRSDTRIPRKHYLPQNVHDSTAKAQISQVHHLHHHLSNNLAFLLQIEEIGAQHTEETLLVVEEALIEVLCRQEVVEAAAVVVEEVDP